MQKLHSAARQLGQRYIDGHILDGPEHQREWSAELMTDVGKECRLGAIDLRERLRALAFRFVRLCIGDSGGDLARDEIQKRGVRLIKRATRTQSGDEKANEPI